jgi:predicted transcriptional regulator
MESNSDDALITLAADIVAAHVSNNSVAINDLPLLIANVHGALSQHWATVPKLAKLLRNRRCQCELRSNPTT